MKRRDFLKQATATGLGAVALTQMIDQRGARAAEKGGFSAFDTVPLPKTGFKVTRLAMGSGTVGGNKASNQTRLGTEKFVGMIRHGHERGLNFWDMADLYGSHTYFRECLKYIPRDKVAILTKSFSRDPKGMQADIERYRKEIGTDYIDVFLLHCLMKPGWGETMKATLDVVSEAREKGIIGTVGCSCHDLGALSEAAEHPWIEFLLARINHDGAKMDGAPDKVAPVLKKARNNGKFVMGMKIVGEGTLRTQIDTSLHYVLGLGTVQSMTIGFESPKEMDDMIDRIARVRV